MKIGFSRQFFEKYPNIKFHENRCSGSRVVPRGQTDGRTDTMKIIVAFRNFANPPKNITQSPNVVSNVLIHLNSLFIQSLDLTTASIEHGDDLRWSWTFHYSSSRWCPLDQVRLYGRFQRTDMRYSTHTGWCHLGPILDPSACRILLS